MKIKSKYLAVIGIVAIAAVAIYFINVSITGHVVDVVDDVEDGQYDDFAKCLTEKGVVMYGAEWCSHCKNQKKMFGSSFQYIDYVECPDNPSLCNSEGITGYPTWKIGGSLYSGERSLESLALRSGCTLS